MGLSYNLPKPKDKSLVYLSKNLSLGVRLRNEKVLGTHPAQTKSNLLDSNDQYTHFCMMLNDMLNTHNKYLTENDLNKFALWMVFSFKENSDLFWKLKNKTWIGKKSDLFLWRVKRKIWFVKKSNLFLWRVKIKI